MLYPVIIRLKILHTTDLISLALQGWREAWGPAQTRVQ